MGTLVPLPALWQLNGAGIGFLQRLCNAEARYVARVLRWGLGKGGGNNPGAATNPPEDQEDAVEGPVACAATAAAGLGQALELPDHGDTFRAVLQVRPERRRHSRAFW